MGNILIRGVDDAAIAKIDQLYKSKGYRSREEYLRTYINNLAVLGELKELDNKYNSLVHACLDVIKTNSETLDRFSEIIESQQ